MSDLDKIDLLAEQEKLSASQALLDVVMAKQKAHKDGGTAMITARNEIPTLRIELQGVQDELHHLRASHESKSKKYEVKKMKWADQNTLLKRICFCDGHDNASDSGEEGDFEDHEELIRERFDMLLQQNTMKKLAFKMKQKQQDFDQISSRISERESVIATFERNESALALALENYNASRKNDGLDSVQETIKSQAKEIGSMKKNTDLLTKKIMQLTTEVQDQRSANYRQQLLIAPLLTQVRSLEYFKEDKNKTITENMKAAYEEGCKYQYHQMVGPYGAGCAVRGRKLAWISSDSDGLIIGLGNKASHYGMVLADATLYQASCPSPYRRTKTTEFIKLYGIDPALVWKHRSVQKLLDVLDWRGAMKDFCAHSYARSYEATPFRLLSEKLIKAVQGENITTDEVSQLLETPDANKSYNEMKVLFEEGLKKHNLVLDNR